jgi:hypothetical protein
LGEPYRDARIRRYPIQHAPIRWIDLAGLVFLRKFSETPAHVSEISEISAEVAHGIGLAGRVMSQEFLRHPPRVQKSSVGGLQEIPAIVRPTLQKFLAEP